MYVYNFLLNLCFSRRISGTNLKIELALVEKKLREYEEREREATKPPTIPTGPCKQKSIKFY